MLLILKIIKIFKKYHHPSWLCGSLQCAKFSAWMKHLTGVLISPEPDQKGKKLQRQKILTFIYLIYNHNWRNISTVYIYNKTSIKRNIQTIKKIHREVGRAKDLSELRYLCIALYG